MYRLALSLIMIPVLLVCSCTTVRQVTQTDPQYDRLFLYRWDLTAIDSGPVQTENTPYLLFTAGNDYRVTGFGGCNILTGSFTLTGNDSIRFGTIVSTMMACLDLGTEQQMTTRLDQAEQWRITGNVLELLQDNRVLLAFTGTTLQAVEQAATTAINGTWELTYLHDLRGTLEAAFPNGKPTLIINMPSTDATGNGGCNAYSTSIKLKDTALSFGPIGATKMYCEEVAEPIYFGTLGKIDSWQLEDQNNLVLSGNGVTMLRFTRK